MAGDPPRCDIELVDPQPSAGVLVVRHLKINGQSVYMPKDTRVEITLGDAEVVTMRLTILPTSVRIGGEV